MNNTPFTKPMLSIYEQVYPEPPPYRKFRLLETYQSIDGYRTRVTNEAYATKEEAVHEVERRTNGE